MWTTERKNLQDVAAAGGGKDLMTLMKHYKQPDEEMQRYVVEYRKPRSVPRVSAEVPASEKKLTQQLTSRRK
jgi:hypothetical protein